MQGQGARAPVAAARDQEWNTVRSLVRELAEERDMQGLAAVAEMSLMAMRQMCERPVTCEELYEMLERLRGLRLDALEMGEEP